MTDDGEEAEASNVAKSCAGCVRELLKVVFPRTMQLFTDSRKSE